MAKNKLRNILKRLEKTTRTFYYKNVDSLRLDLRTIDIKECQKAMEKIVEELCIIILDKQDYLTLLTLNDSKNHSDFEEWRMELQHDFLTMDDFVREIEKSESDRKAYFEIGRLYGTMQLSSRICYEKKKDSQAYEDGITFCGIRHFDEIVSLLDRHKQMTQTELCLELDMNPSALSECLKKILMTKMVVCRRSGKYKVYSLSDDGFRYAKLRHPETQYENKVESLISENVYNSFSLDSHRNGDDHSYEFIDSKEIKDIDFLYDYSDSEDKDSKLEIANDYDVQLRRKEQAYA